VLFPKYSPNNRLKTQKYDTTHHIMVYKPISQSETSQYYDIKGKYAEKMANIKEIFAANLRENRRKGG